MSLTAKIAALMEAVRPEDLHRMPPAARRRLADQCRRLAELADRPPAPRSGVLVELADHRREG